MKTVLRALALIFGLLPALAGAQQFPTVPDHTVLGRIGIGGSSGPSQAIPFSLLLNSLSGAQSANKVYAGPTSGGTANPTFRALVGADLPVPSASTLGGIESYVAVSHQWINAISTAGAPSSTQPAFSDISGNIATSQMNSGTSAGATTFWNGGNGTTGQWSTAVTSTQISAGAGISVSTTAGANPCVTTCNLTVAQSLTNATLQASPGNPTGTASTTGAMMGLGTTCKITPVYSGRVKVEFIGDLVNGGVATTMNVSVRFGTGSAPANAAAPSGTAVGATLQASETGAASNLVPFINGGIITGLSVGVAVWFDLDIFGAANTTSVSNLSCNAMEF